MNDEKKLTEAQSLELITQMISKAKCDYEETGIGAIMWGSLVSFCSLITFGNFYWKNHALNFIWLLTLFAVVPQIIISIRASKKKKYKSYDDDAVGGIWISFGIALFFISIYTSIYEVPKAWLLFLVMYGVPTFATGYVNHFKPMIIGGIVCWLLAIVCFFIDFPYVMLLTTVAAMCAWFIPGIILRRRYKKAMESNV